MRLFDSILVFVYCVVNAVFACIRVRPFIYPHVPVSVYRYRYLYRYLYTYMYRNILIHDYLHTDTDTDIDTYLHTLPIKNSIRCDERLSNPSISYVRLVWL